MDGQILIGKRLDLPSKNSSHCYRLSNVIGGTGTLTVRDDEGKELAPASEQEAVQWMKLIENLAPYMKEKAGPVKPGPTMSVITEKARLSLGPYETSVGKMYLVKGDKVEVLHCKGDEDDWCFVRYQTQDGKNIERWIRARDLTSQQK